MIGRHTHRRNRQSGVALITALLVVAIAGILAIELVWQTNLDVRRTEGLISWEQARQFGYGAEDYAAFIMQQEIFDKEGDEPAYTRDTNDTLCRDAAPTDSSGDASETTGATKGFAFELDEGGMIGGICDLQGRFNLNNLVTRNGTKDELAVRQFRRLLRAVDQLDDTIDLSPQDIDTIVESTVDWIDPDTSPEGFNGAEDDYYTSKDPPYQAANFWFTDTSELLAVNGMTPDIYQALKRHVAALPIGSEHTFINCNTASVPVFMSLGDDVTLENAELWSKPGEECTDDMFTGIIDQAMLPYIVHTTEYFGLQGTIAIGTTRLGMYSLLERTGQTLRVRLRSFGSIEADTGTPKSVTVKDGEVTEDDE